MSEQIWCHLTASHQDREHLPGEAHLLHKSCIGLRGPAHQRDIAQARSTRVRNVRRRWRGSGGREQLERHRRRLGPQGRERLGPQAEVLEDTLRHVGLLDAGDEAHLTLTVDERHVRQR